MNLPRRRFLELAAGASTLPSITRKARAETYPSRTITTVAAGPAGGPTDAIGRVVGQRLQEALRREQQTPEALHAYQKADREMVADHQGGRHQGGLRREGKTEKTGSIQAAYPSSL
jgi:hypothetical protein